MTALRADAQRNLSRVLDAAAEAFSEYGPDVSVDEIARRAGVGHATVFRRFPTKGALIEAVVEERIREVLDLARAALASDDPAAFTDFIWRGAELHARDRGLYDCVDRCDARADTGELAATIAQLVSRAQKAGALRRDVCAADVPALIGGAVKAAPPDQWRLYVGVVLDGLRPPKTS